MIRVMALKTSLATKGFLFYRSYVDRTEVDRQPGRGASSGWGRWALVCLAGLFLGCDSYSEIRANLSSADQARFARGQREATACWSCHDVTGSALKVGPPLGGVLGRRVGAVAAFPYSEALRGSNLVWTEQTLDRFLAAPQRVLPGNRMLSASLVDSQRRADLIFFLSHVSGQGSEPNPAHP